jgi:mannonate dehydratase
MTDLVKVLHLEMQKRRESGRSDFRIPIRPDHGIKLTEDFGLKANPGYPMFGRLKGLAEIIEIEKQI